MFRITQIHVMRVYVKIRNMSMRLFLQIVLVFFVQQKRLKNFQ